MQESLLNLVVRGLATWRLAHLLVYEDGPYEILQLLRIKSGIKYGLDYDGDLKPIEYGGLSPLHCLWCTSIWVGFILWALPTIVSKGLAVSTAAILMEEIREWLERQPEH